MAESQETRKIDSGITHYLDPEWGGPTRRLDSSEAPKQNYGLLSKFRLTRGGAAPVSQGEKKTPSSSPEFSFSHTLSPKEELQAAAGTFIVFAKDLLKYMHLDRNNIPYYRNFRFTQIEEMNKEGLPADWELELVSNEDNINIAPHAMTLCMLWKNEGAPNSNSTGQWTIDFEPADPTKKYLFSEDGYGISVRREHNNFIQTNPGEKASIPLRQASPLLLGYQLYLGDIAREWYDKAQENFSWVEQPLGDEPPKGPW